MKNLTLIILVILICPCDRINANTEINEVPSDLIKNQPIDFDSILDPYEELGEIEMYSGKGDDIGIDIKGSIITTNDQADIESIVIVDDWPPKYDLETFQRNVKFAHYLLMYERMAWLTTDYLKAEHDKPEELLGPEWFCLKKGDQWAAAYGKYDAEQDIYTPAFLYLEEENGIYKVDADTFGDIDLKYPRAIHRVYNELKTLLNNSTIRTNWYIKERNDGKLIVVVLPSRQGENRAYSNGWYYLLSDNGKQFLIKPNNSHLQFQLFPNSYKGAIRLVDDSTIDPSPSFLFYAMRDLKRSNTLYLENKHYTSFLEIIKGDDFQSAVWMRILNDSKESLPRRKNRGRPRSNR